MVLIGFLVSFFFFVGRPDVYAIGFQEFDLTKESFAKNDESRLADWTSKIEHVLALQGSYKRVASSQLVGMLVIVYATEELSRQISDVGTSMVGCGYVNIMGNKVYALSMCGNSMLTLVV